MTEAFKVPEPSKEAFAAAMHEGEFYAPVSGGQVPGAVLQALVAAYAVDIPGIVKAEVERFRDAMANTSGPLSFGRDSSAYLRDRFPEVAPERERPEVICSREGHDLTDLKDECRRCGRVFSQHGAPTTRGAPEPAVVDEFINALAELYATERLHFPDPSLPNRLRDAARAVVGLAAPTPPLEPRLPPRETYRDDLAKPVRRP